VCTVSRQPSYGRPCPCGRPCGPRLRAVADLGTPYPAPKHLIQSEAMNPTRSDVRHPPAYTGAAPPPTVAARSATSFIEGGQHSPLPVTWPRGSLPSLAPRRGRLDRAQRLQGQTPSARSMSSRSVNSKGAFTGLPPHTTKAARFPIILGSLEIPAKSAKSAKAATGQVKCVGSLP